MRLIFGEACDARAFPDFPGECEGAVDVAVVGLPGLVANLEIALGLSGPPISEAVRVATYAAKLAASLGGEQAFFAASFENDRWATAQSLLTWRDHLVGCGWSRRSIGSPRVDALAHVEEAGPELPRGLCDRINALVAILAERPQLELSNITIACPRAVLSPSSARLIDALEPCGVAILEDLVDVPNASGDLGRVQAFLGSRAIEPLVGDGTFTLIEADTALMASEAVAEWLAAGAEAELEGSVILSPDGDSALLDGALIARGLPALGLSAPSSWRGALQVLPLAFKVSWAPFDVRALLDLLLSPRPPIGRDAARRLARALSEEPGIGGAAWRQAWSKIEERLAERFAGEPDAEERISGRLSRWRIWTTGGQFDRTAGMPSDAGRQIAARVAEWALNADAGRGDPLMLAVAGSARALAEAIDVFGQDRLPTLLVERMIEVVLADGAGNPDHVAMAGGLRGVANPTAIWGPVDRLVWWGFKGPGERAPLLPWDRNEIALLASAGCRIETPSAGAARIAWSQANPLRRARERVLLVRPARDGANETTSHPLAHQLAPLMPPSGSAAYEAIHFRAERLLADPRVALAGRRIERVDMELVQTPEARALWRLPAAAIARLNARRESATSFERLTNCQLRWVLRDVLQLRRGRFAEVPGTHQLVGNLAHAIANVVFAPGAPPHPEAAEDAARAVFDDMLAKIAAPLQQPEFAGELAAARSRIPAALKDLARLLHEKGFDVLGTELEREANFGDDLSVQGRLDMLVRHPERGLAVIDLKWTRSSKRRREEIADGRAIQLATYGAIADPAAPGAAPGAYYLLNQRRLIGPVGAAVADEEVETARTLGETWTDLVRTWRIWRDAAAGGAAIATGLPDVGGQRPANLPIDPPESPCAFCELTGLCRIPAEARDT